MLLRTEIYYFVYALIQIKTLLTEYNCYIMYKLNKTMSLSKGSDLLFFQVHISLGCNKDINYEVRNSFRLFAKFTNCVMNISNNLLSVLLMSQRGSSKKVILNDL